jgi:hypothetical protein
MILATCPRPERIILAVTEHLRSETVYLETTLVAPPERGSPFSQRAVKG